MTDVEDARRISKLISKQLLNSPLYLKILRPYRIEYHIAGWRDGTGGTVVLRMAAKTFRRLWYAIPAELVLSDRILKFRRRPSRAVFDILVSIVELDKFSLFRRIRGY